MIIAVNYEIEKKDIEHQVHVNSTHLSLAKSAVSRVPVNLCTNLCYHMQAEGGVRAT